MSIKNTLFDVEQSITDETPVVVTNGKSKKFFFIPKESKIYIKEFNPSEFIGQELCAIQNIRCTYYFIVALGRFDLKRSVWYGDVKDKCGDLMIGSYDLKRKGFQYKTIEDYGISRKEDDAFTKMLSVPTSEENKRKLCLEMLQMLALDIYMGQTDRYCFNYFFEEDENHQIRLAPLFDFECSLDSNMFYDKNISLGDLYHFDTIEDCKEFMRRYPKFRDILSSYLGVDLERVAKSAYGRRRMTIPKRAMDHYKEFDQERKELIKSIVA